MKKRVITISREFGSGGHSIGKIVVKTPGIGFMIGNYWKRLQRKPDFQKNLLKKPQYRKTAGWKAVQLTRENG